MVGSIYLAIYNKLPKEEQEELIARVQREEYESFMEEVKKDEANLMDRNLCPTVL